METMNLPPQGASREELLEKLAAMKSGDSDWEGGRVFSLVYNAGEDVAAMAREAYRIFIAENGLSPFAFPSLLRMETEVVAMLAGLLGGDGGTAGTMTSGGSESIFMAMKAARDYARTYKPEIEKPEVLLPLSAHPAFNKAAHYLGLKTVVTPLRADFTADPLAIREAAGGNTIFMVGSACSYPHGMIDPIGELAAIARERDIWLHVDACVGGLILPFLARLGKDIPPFDFQVEGVSSISADLHKYGYIPKGASVVLYRTGELRKHQFFAYADWPGGVYGTPSLSGSRPGGAIAASWAVMNYLGEEGYLRLAGQISEATSRLQAGIEAIPGLHILGSPPGSVFAFGSDRLNIYALGERMKGYGWFIDSQQLPPSLHMTIFPVHNRIVEPFLADLGRAVEGVANLQDRDISGEAALYGMIGSLPDRGQARDFALEYLHDLYRLRRS